MRLLGCSPSDRLSNVGTRERGKFRGCGIRSLTCAIGLLVANGCATAEYHTGHSAVLQPSLASGLGVLYDQRSTRIGSYTVLAGEPLGFSKSDDTLVAVAGPHRVVLPEGNYRWQLHPAESNDLSPEDLRRVQRYVDGPPITAKGQSWAGVINGLNKWVRVR
jgi:hypothetical protein